MHLLEVCIYLNNPETGRWNVYVSIWSKRHLKTFGKVAGCSFCYIQCRPDFSSLLGQLED